MANFRKSFNFRNGVQVDEDNFIVNSVGLVGIGTSVPTETLDVRGSLKVVGVATIQDAFIGVATITDKLEIGITSLSSGIIAAKSGIITYYGDASNLQGMPTSQWVDADVGLGYTSIYSAGNVGVGTTDPRFTLQIGGNNDVSNFSRGVGISSVGDVTVSGILTATKFYGWGIGVTGLNASDAIVAGTLDNERLPSNINKPTGIITASSVVADSFVGPVTGTATTATSLSGTPNIEVGIVTATKIIADTVEVPNTGITTVSKLLHVGTGGTALAALEGGRLGIGSALPTSELQIRKVSGSLLEIVSEQGESRVSIGQSVGVGKSTALLRYGNVDNTFDIVNNSTGNLNMYLHAGVSGIDTGRFDWIYGQTNAELMSLTYGGSLGVGKTNPDNTLHVVGTSTVTGNSWIGGNLTVSGNINGTLTLPVVIDSNINSSGVSTFNNVSVGNTLTSSAIGIGTTALRSGFIFDVEQGSSIFGNVAINTTSVSENLNVGGFAALNGLGINTTSSFIESGPSVGEAQIHDSSMRFYGSSLVIKNDSKIGFNTNSPRSVIDYGLVGSASTNPYMIMPTITTAAQTGLGQTVEGAIIFNSTTKKFQGYTGTAWVDLH